MADVLLVEDDANARKMLSIGLELHGHQVTACASPEAAERALNEQAFAVVLTDLRMQSRDGGLEVIRLSRQLQPDARVLLLTAYASTETAVLAMKEGAFDYLTKPVSSEELAAAIERALLDGISTATGEYASAPDEVIDSKKLIGNSQLMHRVRDRLRRGAKSDFTILITGESGTGKELAARFVHAHSNRAGGAFVPVHCGAIPEGLFESELFGHRKGAFTGAEYNRVGLIESADGGTLFLDEVGDMPLSAQIKLLRALQEKSIRRVGDDREHDVNIRVIAATNRDLEAEVRQGQFREDLFFRLNVVPVHMPSLRHRPDDIPLLARALTQRWSEGRARLSEGCLQRLGRLQFMGNVRELENLLQRMLALSDSGDLDEELLNEVYSGASAHASVSLAAFQAQALDLDDWLAAVEQQLIDAAMTVSGGNITKAAEQLRISFRSLRYRLKKNNPDYSGRV